MNIDKIVFGQIKNENAFLYTLQNDNNITVKLTNFGGIVTHIMVPDNKGKIDDVVLGFDNLKQYTSDHPYFGALIGRYGNRIANGKFILDGKEYQLAINNGPNHLHGGIQGFDKVIWKSKDIKGSDFIGIELEYLSKDGEENYPGNLKSIVKYILNNKNELVIEYEAVSDKNTIINLTHHGYFNLNGIQKPVYEHFMEINADKITEVYDDLIPTGKLLNIKDGPFDFKKGKNIGQDISKAGGYDHNYILNKKSNELSFAARVTDEESGRILEVYTTEPGMQFYSSNFLDGTIVGKNDIVYNKHYAFCLETQHFPDSPNHKDFPSTLLKAGEIYKQTTIYKFSNR